MAVISMFYGIIVSMFYFDNKQHKLPHIHVKYQDEKAVFAIGEVTLISGKMKTNKRKLVEAWILIHKDALMANWELAVSGQEIFKIEPLK